MVFSNGRDWLLQSVPRFASKANGWPRRPGRSGRRAAPRAGGSNRNRFGQRRRFLHPSLHRNSRSIFCALPPYSRAERASALGWKQSNHAGRGVTNGRASRREHARPLRKWHSRPGALSRRHLGREEFSSTQEPEVAPRPSAGPISQGLAKRSSKRVTITAAGSLALHRQYASLGRHGPARPDAWTTRISVLGSGRSPRQHLPDLDLIGRRSPPRDRPGWTPTSGLRLIPPDLQAVTRSTIEALATNLPFPKTLRPRISQQTVRRP